MTSHFLLQSFVYLIAAVIVVPLAKRIGLGSVLGYLIAGILIGPWVLNLSGSHEDVKEFAEFGVVMMLFVIGLELRPAMLWRLRGPILGMGTAQVGGTTAAVAAVAMLAGFDWKMGVATGCILAMSSTAIVLQSLAERGQLKVSGGQASFSVLLFQDVAVIPILALLPLLGSGLAPHADAGPLAALPAWARGLVTIAAVALVVFAGHFATRPVFRFIAKTELREIFTIITLLLVIGVTLLMNSVGLSPALGAFLGGVVLADSEYRHELEADIEPFKGLLLGLFFITVGAGIDFPLIARHPGLIATLVAALIVVKFAVLLALGRVSRLDWSQSLLFAFALAQGGEFCFVLFQFASTQQILSAEIVKPLVATVAVSMALTPLLFLANERLVQPRFAKGKTVREPDEITEHDHPVILAGFGRFGHMIGRLLRANDFGVTVLDSDPDQVEVLGRFGLKSFYGDATRLDLLESAGAAQAKLFIIAIDDEVKSLDIVRMVQRSFPHLRIFARAVSRQHAHELIRAGVDDVFRDTFGSSMDLGTAALRALGFRAYQARRAGYLMRVLDEATVRDMADLTEVNEEYVSRARKHILNLENLLRADRIRRREAKDQGWESGGNSDARQD